MGSYVPTAVGVVETKENIFVESLCFVPEL